MRVVVLVALMTNRVVLLEAVVGRQRHTYDVTVPTSPSSALGLDVRVLGLYVKADHFRTGQVWEVILLDPTSLRDAGSWVWSPLFTPRGCGVFWPD